MVLGVIPKGRGKKSGNASDSPTTSTTEPVEVVKEPEESAKTQIPPESADPKVVTKARRRLSVDGHDVSLDGIEDSGIVDGYGGTPVQEKESDEAFFIGSFAGKSQKGYVPYNPRKVNQDYMLIREDHETKTLVLGTFDGHGEHGHCISEVGIRMISYSSLSVQDFIIILYNMKSGKLTSKQLLWIH